MPFTGSFNVQGSFGEISAANFDSGTASAGQVLTADGSGGAAFAAGGGIPIPVTADWSVWSNLATDILNAFPVITTGYLMNIFLISADRLFASSAMAGRDGEDITGRFESPGPFGPAPTTGICFGFPQSFGEI